MRRRVIKKLTARAGESIGETLVALLISALALMMLAGAVSSGMRVVTNSNAVLKEYYAANNNIVAKEAPYDKALNVSMEGLSADGLAIPVHCWENDVLSTEPVITYSIQQ